MTARIRRMPGDPLLYGPGVGLIAAVSAMAFGLATVGQQLVLLSLGGPIELQVTFRQTVIVALVLLVVGVVTAAYRDEQVRGSRALRRAQLLEQAATEIGAETGADV